MSLITQTQTNSSRVSNNIRRENGGLRNNNNREDEDKVEISQDNIYRNKGRHAVRKVASAYDPDSQNRNLNRYINCITEESLLVAKNRSNKESNDNITIELRHALHTLKDKIKNDKIVISKADKGSGIVVVDYDMYINKGTKYIEEEAKANDKVEESAKTIVNKLVKIRNKVI